MPKPVLPFLVLLFLVSACFAQEARENFSESFKLSFGEENVSLAWNKYGDNAASYEVMRKAFFVENSFRSLGKTEELSFTDETIDRQAYVEAYAAMVSQRLKKEVKAEELKGLKPKYFYKIDVLDSSGVKFDESFPKTIEIPEEGPSQGQKIETRELSAEELRERAKQASKAASAAANTTERREKGLVQKIENFTAVPGKTSVLLGWKKYENANLEYLRVFYSQNKADLELEYVKKASQEWVPFLGAESFTVENLEPEKTYFFRLVAFDKENLVLAESDIAEANLREGIAGEPYLSLEPKTLYLDQSTVSLDAKIFLLQNLALEKNAVSVKEFETGSEVPFTLSFTDSLPIEAGKESQFKISFNKDSLEKNKSYIVSAETPTGQLRAVFDVLEADTFVKEVAIKSVFAGTKEWLESEKLDLEQFGNGLLLVSFLTVGDFFEAKLFADGKEVGLLKPVSGKEKIGFGEHKISSSSELSSFAGAKSGLDITIKIKIEKNSEEKDWPSEKVQRLFAQKCYSVLECLAKIDQSFAESVFRR